MGIIRGQGFHTLGYKIANFFEVFTGVNQYPSQWLRICSTGRIAHSIHNRVNCGLGDGFFAILAYGASAQQKSRKLLLRRPFGEIGRRRICSGDTLQRTGPMRAKGNALTTGNASRRPFRSVFREFVIVQAQRSGRANTDANAVFFTVMGVYKKSWHSIFL